MSSNRSRRKASLPPLWRASSDPVVGGFVHATRGGMGHSWLAPIVGTTFAQLRVGASIWDGNLWWLLNEGVNLGRFELEHGVETERWKYNERMLEKVRSGKRAVLGEHRGLHDFFVPIVVEGEVVGLLVVGPIATHRVSTGEVLERWRSLTGRPGDLADLEFKDYLDATLSVLVLEGAKLRKLERALSLFARLMSGEGRADALANQATALAHELTHERFVEKMWEWSRTIVDERRARAQYSAAMNYDLGALGLARAADQVLVGLTVAGPRQREPVDHAIRRDAFQRAAVDLSRAHGDVIAGRVGGDGVVFLFGLAGTSERKKRKVLAFSERVAALARRFGLSVHLGAYLAAGQVGLNRGYLAALDAAERALGEGKRLQIAVGSSQRARRSLRALREELRRVIVEQPELLPACFERYIEAVRQHSGYRVELARAELEICFEWLADTLLKGAALDRKGLSELSEAVDRSVAEVTTLSDLLGVYRASVADLLLAARSPTVARQERSLRAALDHVQQHYGEPLDRDGVAKVSGFAPQYFSKLFKRHTGVPFEKYLFELRLERAKQLLSGTDLSVTRIAELSGYGSSQYLSRVFRKAVGTTPLGHRRALLRDLRDPAGKKQARTRFQKRAREG